jgi:hypothetical protein
LNPRTRHFLWDPITSLKLTLACLSALMVLVLACTLAQVNLGTWAAVDVYMRAFFIWWDVPGTTARIPIFPGGATVGLVLLVNLVAAQGRRLERSWKKAGIWIAHAGLVLLVLGEFVTGVFQVESQLAVEEGQTVNFVEAPRDLEVAVVDTTDPEWDEVYSVPASRLERGGTVAIPGTPVSLAVKRFYRNAHLGTRGSDAPPAIATTGIGTTVAARELAPVSRDDQQNQAAAWVEPVAGGRSYGTWLLSNGIAAPQAFVHEGRRYELLMRNRREYLPFAVTLKDFRHDVYAGTQIPKNFSSLVRLTNPTRGEARDVLIYMNQPLRYEGKAFYQASFGKGDTLSILQVVENPGWLLPYVSCALVAAGLVVHFAITLLRSTRRRLAAAEAAR